MTKELPILPLFEQFIHDSAKGRRLKPNGQKIKPKTVKNYEHALRLLEDFEGHKAVLIRIRTAQRMNAKKFKVEVNYWKKFYRHFTEFLQKEKGCFDNYIGSVFKTLHTFFNYLKKDKMLNVGDFHKCFYIHKEEIPIVTLMPAQLQFLINNLDFDRSLSLVQLRTKDLFVFGCTVALRYSDLINIRMRDFELIGGSMYLSVKSIKTDQVTKIKLPQYAVDIVSKYGKRKKTKQPGVQYDFHKSAKPEHPQTG